MKEPASILLTGASSGIGLAATAIMNPTSSSTLNRTISSEVSQDDVGKVSYDGYKTFLAELSDFVLKSDNALDGYDAAAIRTARASSCCAWTTSRPTRPSAR